MRPTISQYAQVLEELAAEEPAEAAQETSHNFVEFLRSRGESKKLPAIVAQLEKRAREKQGAVVVTAVTAFAPAAESQALIERMASKLFPKQRVTLVYQTDSRVIAGVLLRTDEVLFDATLATRLAALQKTVL